MSFFSLPDLRNTYNLQGAREKTCLHSNVRLLEDKPNGSPSRPEAQVERQAYI
jgi:hypothetical protein